MPACTLFNEQEKGPNLLSISTWSVLGKQNVQEKKVYSSLYIFPVGSFVQTFSYDILCTLHDVDEMEWSKEKTREGAVIFWIGDFCRVVVVIAQIPRGALADSRRYFNFSSWLNFPFMLKFIF